MVKRGSLVFLGMFFLILIIMFLPTGQAQICEATGSGTCTYISPTGNDANPGTFALPFRTAENLISAGLAPGSVVYLRGGTYDSTFSVTGSTAGVSFFIRIRAASGSGTAANPITLKNYPGENPLITGLDSVSIASVSFWNIEGLNISGGYIGVNEGNGDNTHDIYITGNHVHHRSSRANGNCDLPSNPGLLKVFETISGRVGPWNIFFENNTINDYDAECTPWNLQGDAHFGGFEISDCSQDGGCRASRIYFRNNTVYNVPAFFYIKMHIDGRLIIEGNRLYNSLQGLGEMRSDFVFRNNLVYGVIRTEALHWDGPEIENATVENNTFINMNMIVNMEARARTGNIIRNNVYYGFGTTGPSNLDQSYIWMHSFDSGGPLLASPANEIDNNCFITLDTNFLATTFPPDSVALNITQMRSTLGYELTSDVIEVMGGEDETNFFQDPANGDYTLIGTAATTCAGRGANLGAGSTTPPTISITSPNNLSTINGTRLTVVFSTVNWTVGGKGNNHVHFHLDGSSDRLMFYNSPDNIVEFNTVPGPTSIATWISSTSIRFNNLLDGTHTIIAQLANPDHTVLSNPGSTTTISISMNSRPKFTYDWSEWWSNETTNFSLFNETQLQDMPEVNFLNGYGGILFLENLNFSRLISFDLRDKIKILFNKVWVNSSLILEFNKSAQLTFRGVTFTNPIIKIDDVDCPVNICQNISFDSATSTYRFNVTSFSVFEIVEQCSDGVQNYDETGVDCGGSCGSCFIKSNWIWVVVGALVLVGVVIISKRKKII